MQVGCECGQLLSRSGMENFQVDGPVAMDNPIPQPGRLLPRYVWELILDLSRKLCSGLAEYGEVFHSKASRR